MAVPPTPASEETQLLLPVGEPVSPELERSRARRGKGDEDAEGPSQSVGSLRAALIMLSLWLLIFLQASNMSGLTTTQSKIAEDLDAFATANWFTSSYLIAMSSIAPLAGRLSQLFSPRTCILVSALLFGIGGLVTSQARTFEGFIAGRVVSGVGSAGIMTISIILVLELTSKKKRGLFIGLLNAGYTSGVSLGAVVAGAAAPVIGWRALFWSQTPIAILAGIGIFFSIPRSFVSGPGGANNEKLIQKLAKVDYFGALMLVSTLVLFLFGLSSPVIQWLPIALSALTLPIFVVNEIYLTAHPIIPITILSSRGVLLTCLAQLLFMASRWTVLFYTPVYALAIKTWNPATAGAILIPTNLGFAAGGLLAGWLHIKRAGSFYASCLASMVAFASMQLVLSQISRNATEGWIYILTVFINGFFTGASLNYTLAQILHLSPPSSHFIVTSLLATFRGFAGSFGSAIGGGVFLRSLSAGLEKGFKGIGLPGDERAALVRKLLGQPALVGSLRGATRAAAIKGYEGAVGALFIAATASALAALVVQAAAGWSLGVEKEEEAAAAAAAAAARRREDEDDA